MLENEYKRKIKKNVFCFHFGIVFYSVEHKTSRNLINSGSELFPIDGAGSSSEKVLLFFILMLPNFSKISFNQYDLKYE